MVIKDIDMTKEKQLEIEEMKREKERIQKTNIMCKSFNTETDKNNIHFKILRSDNSEYAHLYEIKKFLFFEYKEQLNQMFYDKRENTWSFIHGLKYKHFEKIQKVLQNIPIKFEVELSEGKVPANYQVIKELKKQ